MRRGLLYTPLFRLLVALVQGIYLVGTQGFTFNKKVLSYLIASAVSLLAFAWDGIFNGESKGSRRGDKLGRSRKQQAILS